MNANILYSDRQGPDKGNGMREKEELGVLLSMARTACPLCSGKKAEGALFCSRCGRSRRLHIDPTGIREVRKEVYIPRQLVR
jgi:hypothetical protein